MYGCEGNPLFLLLLITDQLVVGDNTCWEEVDEDCGRELGEVEIGERGR